MTTNADPIDMSPDAIARRLEEVRALHRLMQYLAGFRRTALLDAIVAECRRHCEETGPELTSLVDDVLYGSRNLIGALEQRLLTQTEVANGLVARLDTWLSHRGVTLQRADELAACVRELVGRR